MPYARGKGLKTVPAKAWQVLYRRPGPALPESFGASLQTVLEEIGQAARALPDREKSMIPLQEAAATSFAALAKFGSASKGAIRRELRSYLSLQEKATGNPILSSHYRIPVLHTRPGLPAADRLHAELDLAASNGAAALRHLEKGETKKATHRAYMMAANLFQTVENDLRSRYDENPVRRSLAAVASLFERRTENSPNGMPSYYASLIKPPRIPHSSR